MNPDAKTPSALIALARARRTQRALAHAYLHRHAPMPTLRSSLGYMTATACVTEHVTAGVSPVGHRMTLLGVARNEGVAYVVEELGGGAPPIVYRLWLCGPRLGHLVPIHAWYERPDDADEIRARIAALAPSLEPGLATTAEAFMLSTRVVQRRALRVASVGGCSDLPIRKFALQLVIEPVSGHGPSGRTTVTAFLRPQAQLVDVWTLPAGGTPTASPIAGRSPGHVAIARVSYTGIPSGLGLDKETMVLLTAGLDEVDDLDDLDDQDHLDEM